VLQAPTERSSGSVGGRGGSGFAFAALVGVAAVAGAATAVNVARRRNQGEAVLFAPRAAGAAVSV
jgi:hypothetical protein